MPGMSGLLEGKRLLVTGVLTDDSLAFAAARLAQEQGAQLVLTGAGRGLRLTQRVAKHLPEPPDVLELDVTVPGQVDAVRDELQKRWGGLDGVVHAIAFAPAAALGGGFLDTGWDDVKVAIEISAYSLKLLAVGMRPLLVAAGGGSIVGLDFDATVAWPGYDWMGVAKAALESTARYLARDLGQDRIRVNLVAAGPVRTLAAKSIPGFSLFEDVWDGRAPLGWDINDPEPVGRACVALMSDWFPATTGEMVHVDGGFHAMGA
jgi:meromycolic acid enoyl-[acyl-carrier-protein] reductase